MLSPFTTVFVDWLKAKRGKEYGKKRQVPGVKCWGEWTTFFYLSFFLFFVLVAWLCSSCFECVFSFPWNCRLHHSVGRTSLIRVEWECISGIFLAHSNLQSGATCSTCLIYSQHKPLRWDDSTQEWTIFLLFLLLLLMLLVPLFPMSCWLFQVCWEGNLVIRL